jgi:mannose-1-phosphate guanylyltransferase/mannose-1-phosphate guanylyltransferase/mannose-6-phosphate isomerase
VILSGGAGTRLWPLSTPERPKQFLALTGDRTMLQLTAERVADAGRFDPPLVIGAEAHRETIERQLGGISAAPARLILEPCGRGTAAAAALAALVAAPDELLLMMPSDHLIGQPERLAAAVEAAVPAVLEGWLATFGVAATRPDTGYGYIRRGEEIGPGVRRAARFVEKPDAEAAGRMLAEGGHDWNAGIFLFRAGDYIDQLRLHAPDILAVVEESLAGVAAGEGPVRPDGSAFGRCRAESIDRAVMEKAERIAVVPVEMSWSDIGSWDALFEISSRDGEGNSVTGPAAVIGGRGCLVRSEGPRVVAIGVENLIVVATGDAVLVIPQGDSQRVREALERAEEWPGQAAGKARGSLPE